MEQVQERKNQRRKNFLGLKDKAEKLGKGEMTFEDYVKCSKTSIEDLEEQIEENKEIISENEQKISDELVGVVIKQQDKIKSQKTKIANLKKKERGTYGE